LCADHAEGVAAASIIQWQTCWEQKLLIHLANNHLKAFLRPYRIPALFCVQHLRRILPEGCLVEKQQRDEDEDSDDDGDDG
jgi:hypothetical protein